MTDQVANSEEWRRERRRFLQLITDRDLEADLPLALRLDLTPSQTAIIAPGVTDYDQLLARCTAWVENFLAPQVARMAEHLDYLGRHRS